MAIYFSTLNSIAVATAAYGNRFRHLKINCRDHGGPRQSISLSSSLLTILFYVLYAHIILFFNWTTHCMFQCISTWHETTWLGKRLRSIQEIPNSCRLQTSSDGVLRADCALGVFTELPSSILSLLANASCCIVSMVCAEKMNTVRPPCLCIGQVSVRLKHSLNTG